MNTDSYFYIGHSHNICEDYAMTNIFNSKIGIAIVSDGCSASEDVDIGSRVLSKVCNNILLDTININTFEFTVDKIKEKIIYSADYAIKELNINHHSLDATLLFAITDGKKIKIRAYGDGFIIFQLVNGDVEFYKISYESNAPYYLSYLLNKEDREKYMDVFGRPKLIQHYVNMKLMSTKMCDPLEDFELDIDIKEKNIKTCSLSSDGIDSYMCHVTPIDCTSVVSNFISFKNLSGDFVKRRLKAYARECIKNNIKHDDDISLSSIII